MKFTQRIGSILLAIFLILLGLTFLIPALSSQGMHFVLGGLAIAAGIFILIDR